MSEYEEHRDSAPKHPISDASQENLHKSVLTDSFFYAVDRDEPPLRKLVQENQELFQRRWNEYFEH